MISSYSKVHTLGHPAVKDLFTVPVIVEEKIDGSQISFKWSALENGLEIRSKGAPINPDAPDKLFTEGVTEIKKIAPLLTPGWTYRGEYLKKPKHNTLKYNRIPKNHIIIFDIDTGVNAYLSYAEKVYEANRIGLECAPILQYCGAPEPSSLEKPTVRSIQALLDAESCLGGTKIEGVVVKPATGDLFDRDGKVLMGKFVSEAFKEAHTVEWKASNPAGKDIIGTIAQSLRTPARWEKAVQHLRDAGLLENSPRDIGSLLKELEKDLQEEEKDAIMGVLWKWAWPHILRQARAGVPEWYKTRLMESQFEDQGGA